MSTTERIAMIFSHKAVVLAVLLAATSAWTQPVLRIMPLGDSITYGIPVAGGYRAPLYQLLTNAGHNVDFIGTQTANGVAGLPDSDHEGYSGYTIAAIDSILPGVFNAVAKPDIILLLLGVNDYRSGQTAQATNRLETLVVRLATNWPNAKIVVASLTEVSEPLNTQIQTMFNAFLPGICERQRGLGRQVYFTDMHSAVPLADMPDQLHPNQLGYRKMATNWFAAVQTVLCTNCPPRFIAQPANQIVLPGTNVSLVATVVGTGPIRYQWRFEGTNIANATNAIYSFTNVSLTNGHGNFSVAVTDDIGTTISPNAFVFVRISPSILTHPVAQTVLQGQSATFTCFATGAPPIFYRWIRTGLPVFTNTTGIGVFTNVQSTLINGIRCVVMNAAGSLNSSNVNLIVIPDFDGDGIADSWEAQYGLNTNSAADALSDFDGDRMSNRDEYIAGTNPHDASSLLKLTLTTINPALLQLQFAAQSNIAYAIQYGTNLTLTPWNTLTNISAPTETRTVQVNVPVPPQTRETFYRVVTRLVQ